jgi:hypothetical protein
MQQGLSRAYSDEYAKSQHLSDDQLVARAGQLHDKAAKGNSAALDGLAAIRTLRAERGALLAEQQAAIIAAQPRSGAVPLWAPAAFLAIVALGVVLTMRRRR